MSSLVRRCRGREAEAKDVVVDPVDKEVSICARYRARFPSVVVQIEVAGYEAVWGDREIGQRLETRDFWRAWVSVHVYS